ncbi:hypothetical protein K7432_006009 [Basidiobolus ranarum]|uniref:Protein UNC80 C-terminal domain-containing protein n=1 Tax=Basidiobolus ranarum TaxID=34480 RepID=A0ABR2WVN9_9FUNG
MSTPIVPLSEDNPPLNNTILTTSDNQIFASSSEIENLRKLINRAYDNINVHSDIVETTRFEISKQLERYEEELKLESISEKKHQEIVKYLSSLNVVSEPTEEIPTEPLVATVESVEDPFKDTTNVEDANTSAFYPVELDTLELKSHSRDLSQLSPTPTDLTERLERNSTNLSHLSSQTPSVRQSVGFEERVSSSERTKDFSWFGASSHTKTRDHTFQRELDKYLFTESKIHRNGNTVQNNASIAGNPSKSRDQWTSMGNISIGGQTSFAEESSLEKLWSILKKNKNMTSVPYMAEILSELAIPFYQEHINVKDCMLSLDIFEFLRSNFQFDEIGYHSMILWGAHRLTTKHILVKLRAFSIFESIFDSVLNTPEHLLTIPVIHAIIHIIVFVLAISLPAHSSNLVNNEENHRLREKALSFVQILYGNDLLTCMVFRNEGEYISINDSSNLRISDKDSIGKYIVIEGLILCLRHNSFEVRKLVLTLLNDEYFTPSLPHTPYYEHVLNLLFRSASRIMSDPSIAGYNSDMPSGTLPDMIAKLICNRVPADIHLKTLSETYSALARFLITGLLFNQRAHDLTRANDSINSSRHGSQSKSRMQLGYLLDTYLCNFWDSGRKEEMVNAIKELLLREDLRQIVGLYQHLVYEINPSIGAQVLQNTLPDIFVKLSGLTHFTGYSELQELFLRLSVDYPVQFYKPFVSCVRTNSKKKIARFLHLFDSLNQLINPEKLLFRDVDLIVVLLLSNVRKEQPSHTKNEGPQKVKSEQITLGQLVLMQEVIWSIQSLRETKSNSHDREVKRTHRRFLVDLEKKLAKYLMAWAITDGVVIPSIFKTMLCRLFREIRLYSGYTSRPIWMSKIMTWLYQTNTDPTQNDQASQEGDPEEKMTDNSNLGYLKMKEVYEFQEESSATALQSNRSQSYSSSEILNGWSSTGPSTPSFEFTTILWSSGTRVSTRRERKEAADTRVSAEQGVEALDFPTMEQIQNPTEMMGHILRVAPTSKTTLAKAEKLQHETWDLSSRILELFVTVHQCIREEEVIPFLQYIWDYGLADSYQLKLETSAFLLNHFAEKYSITVQSFLREKLYSQNGESKIDAITKLYVTFSQRLRINVQLYVHDASNARPFRNLGSVLPFVPTDLGSPEPTTEIPEWLLQLRNHGTSLKEIQMIQELGWEDESETEQDVDLRKTFTLLPTLYLNSSEPLNDASNSSGVRPVPIVTVPILEIISQELLELAFDKNSSVRAAADNTILYCLRDDPNVFLKLYFERMTNSKISHQQELLSKLLNIVAYHKKGPPEFGFVLFNYLLGYLRWYSRDGKNEGLEIFSYVAPLLAEIVPSTNQLSVREFRKNKLDVYYQPSGQLWFTDGTPNTMFPRGSDMKFSPFDMNPFKVPSEVFFAATVRIGQTHFMSGLAKRYPHEVELMRKMVQLFTPIPWKNIQSSIWDGLDRFPEEEFFPKIAPYFQELFEDQHWDAESSLGLHSISTLQCRAWLRYIEVLFRSVHSTYHDRQEFSRIIAGVNNVLHCHPNDLGLAAQAIILYINTATKFERMFKSSRGYFLFLPALFRSYCEAKTTETIRSSIEYAWGRFYEIHEESFIFQAMGSLIPIILKSFAKSKEFGTHLVKCYFKLMKVLREQPVSDRLGVATSAITSEGDAAIYNMPEVQVKNLTKASTSAAAVLRNTLPHRKSNFTIEDLFKLFMTIIAHDPGSLRAQQFIQILPHLLPLFVKEGHEVKNLVIEGIVALVNVFYKFSRNAKPVSTGDKHDNFESIDGMVYRAANEDMNFEQQSTTFNTNTTRKKNWKQNDHVVIKVEFLQLIQTYAQLGFPLSTVEYESLSAIIKSVLRDYNTIKGFVSSDWIRDFIVETIFPLKNIEEISSAMSIIFKHLAPTLRTYQKSCDFSGILQSITLVVQRYHKRMKSGFYHMLLERFINPSFSIITREEIGERHKHFVTFCDTLVNLFCVMTVYTKVDTFEELNKIILSPITMRRIIIPICLRLDVSPYLVRTSPLFDKEGQQRAIQHWMNIIKFLTRNCLRAVDVLSKLSSLSNLQISSMPEASSTESVTQSLTQHTFSASAMLMLHFIALKITMLRSDCYLAADAGIWADLSHFIHRLASTSQLIDANSDNHQSIWSPKAGSGSHDVPPSPTASILPSPVKGFLPDPSVSLKPFEYVMWSFLEFLTLYQHPTFPYFQSYLHIKLQSNSGVVHFRNTVVKSMSPNRYPGISSPESAYSRPKWKPWGGSRPLVSQGKYSKSDRLTPSPSPFSSSSKPTTPDFSNSPQNENPFQDPPTINIETESNFRQRKNSNLTVNTEPLGLSHHSAPNSPRTPNSVESRRPSFDYVSSSVVTSNKLFDQTLRIIEAIEQYLGINSSMHAPHGRIRSRNQNEAQQQLLDELNLIIEFFPTLFRK